VTVPGLAQVRSRLVRQGFWAVADQGLFATSNFLVSVMLARWLAPKDYGAFTVAYTVLLLFGTAHTALLTEPMLVFGAGRFRGRWRPYLGALMKGHWKLTLPAGALLTAGGVAVWTRHDPVLAQALIGFGVAAPFILLPWLLRRACYVRLEPRLAAAAGAVNLAAVTAGLAVLSASAALSVPRALAVMAAASILASAWLLFKLRLAPAPRSSGGITRDVFRQHWEYGRWSMATLALSWVPGNVYYLVLPAHLGLEASAGLKALMNLILPIQHVNTALAVFLVPVFVASRGTPEFVRLVNRALLVFAAGSFAYWSLLVALRGPLMNLLYRGRYAWDTQVFLPLGLFLLMTVVVNVIGSALRAMERPDQVFRANVWSTIVALTAGSWAAIQWGVPGASAALALGATLKAAGLWGYYRRLGQPALPLEERRVISATPAV
jgi:O-antigen/teichoic acid export membrane protein